VTDAPTEREDEGAWARLRRRKVVQWGVACVTDALVQHAADRRTSDRAMRQLGAVARPQSDRRGPRRARLSTCVLATLLAACGPSAPGTGPSTAADSVGQLAREEPVVNFANFIEEIAPDTLPEFTRDTGIAVNYDTFESNQALESRLVVGKTGFDVVVPSNNFLERQIKAGLYQALDRTKLPNLRHVDPVILKQLERNDPGNRHAVPYVWGTYGLGYDADKVERVLGGAAPDSWALLFDPRNAARLAKCGIVMLDVPWLMTSMALLYLGRDPNSERPEDLAAAMDALLAIRPYVREITSSSVTRQLADGEACIAVGPNSDFHLARRLARENGRNADIRYLIPQEGSLVWIDVLAIPIDAPHPDNAHRLIDNLLRPDVIAKVTESTGYANANASATPLVPAELRSDPSVYPDAATLPRLQMNAAHTDEFSRQQNREFTRFWTGQ
jgi:putrescine transport system substrate-binding protein